ncbi:MAG: hypothetical protein KIT10_04950 [Flavobacteriales bacterium]|nr:hypothetical protein [Flavobacteriales bacterium]
MDRVFTFALLGLFAPSVHAQSPESHQLGNSAYLRLSPLAGGGHLILSERRFGIDSSHAQVLLVDAGWNVTPLAARRFQYPLWYMFDAAPIPTGMVVSGALTSGSIPQLHAVDMDGSLAWVTGFAGMQHSQHRIAMLFSEGPAIYGYTSQDGFFGSGMYRVEAEQTGTSFAFRLTTVSNTQFRFYSGAMAGTPAEHVLGGSIRNTGTNDYDALLGHFDASGATWMKRLDLGAPVSGIEQVSGVVRMTNGEHAWALMASGSPARGYFLRMDMDGNPLAGAVIEDPAGIYLAAIIQLDDGSLLLSGSRGNTPILIRLTDTGSLISTMECSNCTTGGIGRFQRDAAGDLIASGSSVIFVLSADGEACGYVPNNTVTSSPYSPAFVDLAPVNNLTPTVTTTDLIMLERDPVGSIAQVCGATGIQEASGRSTLAAYPVPCGDRLWLGTPGEVARNEWVVVHDLSGALVADQGYGDGLDVRSLAPGMYVAVLPRLSQRALFMRAAD